MGGLQPRLHAAHHVGEIVVVAEWVAAAEAEAGERIVRRARRRRGGVAGNDVARRAAAVVEVRPSSTTPSAGNVSAPVRSGCTVSAKRSGR